jgi:hypothetical protein
MGQMYLLHDPIHRAGLNLIIKVAERVIRDADATVSQRSKARRERVDALRAVRKMDEEWIKCQRQLFALIE